MDKIFVQRKEIKMTTLKLNVLENLLKEIIQNFEEEKERENFLLKEKEKTEKELKKLFVENESNYKLLESKVLDTPERFKLSFNILEEFRHYKNNKYSRENLNFAIKTFLYLKKYIDKMISFDNEIDRKEEYLNKINKQLFHYEKISMLSKEKILLGFYYAFVEMFDKSDDEILTVLNLSDFSIMMKPQTDPEVELVKRLILHIEEKADFIDRETLVYLKGISEQILNLIYSTTINTIKYENRNIAKKYFILI